MPREIKLVENIKGTSRKILEENLRSGEPVHVFMEGLKGQSVAATDSRLMIIKVGARAGGLTLFGKKCKSFPYEHITSLDCNKGMMMGRLQVTAAGTHEERGGYFRAYAAENVVNFNADSYGKFQQATNKIRELMDDFKMRRISAAPVGESIPDQIRKLAELKDSGIITEQEFEQKKTQLLERM